MIVCGVILIIFAALWLRYRNFKKEIFSNLPQKGNELKELYPVAYAILIQLKNFKITFSNQSRRQKIERLNIIAERKDSEILYNVRRMAIGMAVLFLAAAMGILYGLSNRTESLITDNSITRPSYEKEKEVVQFLANDNTISVEIHPREYTLTETQENFTKAYEYLLNKVQGENTSLEEVSGNLNLITYIEPYAIKVSWMSSNPELIDINGNVNNEEFVEGNNEKVVLTAVCSYLNYEYQNEIEVRVVPRNLTGEEAFVRDLKKMIKEQEAYDRTQKQVVLPKEVSGVPVSYREEKEDLSWVFLLLGVVAAVAIFPGMDKDLDGKIKERNQQMMLDYSEIISKLNILSGAGMSILRGWEKIVRDYEKKIGEDVSRRRYAYEEMKITYYEIQSGISESNAYSNFGRRCNIHEYLKLGALLEQNVKKGAKGLGKMLEEESMQAFEQRKNLARKLGEEAGTKLLIPMIIMLAIVMVIVLIPAFTSFSV